MDYDKLAQSLTDDEIEELASALYKERVSRFKQNVPIMEPMNAYEKLTYGRSKYAAVSSYKNRVGCSLLQAKMTVEAQMSKT